MKEIQGITWIADWRPGTLNVPAYPYYGGYDIHILRNRPSTGSLLQYVYVRYKDTANGNQVGFMRASDFIVDPSTDFLANKMFFIPTIIGSQAHNVFTPFVFNDVSMNMMTGEITANTSTGGNHLKNFNFMMTVAIGNTANNFFINSARVHVHDDINKAWLTPSVLTLRPDSDDYRFTVLADFTEGVVGDISYHPGITWTSSDPSKVTVDPATGHLRALVPGVGSNGIVITATISPALNSVAGITIATATVRVDPSWADITQPDIKADLVEGSGIDKFTEVPNILFLCDGFDNSADVSSTILGDRSKFDKIVCEIATSMRNPSKDPWKTFLENSSVNLWSAFLPSNERVCTMLSDVILLKELVKFKPVVNGVHSETTITVSSTIEEYIAKANGALSTGGFPIFFDLLVPNNLNTTNTRYKSYRGRNRNALGQVLINPVVQEWDLTMLVSVVGYPTPSDVSASPANVLLKWKALFDASLTLDDNGTQTPGTCKVNEFLYKLWLQLDARRIIDEHDTVYGISMGSRPRAGSSYFPVLEGEIIANVARGLNYNPQRADRKNIDKLLARIKNVDGVVIGTNWAFDNSNNRGKDYDAVVILCAGPRYGGIRLNDFNDGQKNRGVLVSLEEDTNVRFKTVSGRRNELDINEYIPPKSATKLSKQIVPHELSHAFLLGDEYGAQLTGFDPSKIGSMRNLQAESVLMSGGQLLADDIRWRWLRIEKAGVLTATPPVSVSAGVYTLELKKAPAVNFKVNEKVYLRQKNLPEIDPAAQVPPLYFSPELTVTNVSGANITVSGLASLTLAIEGSVLIKPDPLVINGVGTVKSGANSTLIGTGTYFEVQAKVNSVIKTIATPAIASQTATITAITNNGLITVSPALSIASGVKFTLTPPAAEQYAELLTHTVRATIARNDLPMTLAPCNQVNSKEYIGGQIQKPTNIQLKINTTPKKTYYDIQKNTKIKSSAVVGLFYGGAEYACGVFHPTGSCMMRDNNDTNSIFCPVCRYLLVDKIDPSLHGEMYRLYNALYPKI